MGQRAGMSPELQGISRLSAAHPGVDYLRETIGDSRAFAAMQRDRLVARGIDIAPYFTDVKLYRRSLYDGVILQGARFDGFSHVDDRVPQRLVTATGLNPLRGDPSCCRATRPPPGPVFRNVP